MRSIGRLGWGGGSSAPPAPPTPVTPADITANYPYQIIQVNAKNVWLPSYISAVTPSLVYLDIPGSTAVPAIKMPGSGGVNDNRIYFMLSFNRSELDIVTPSFKLSFNWINFDDALAPSPTRYVKFNVGARNALKNSTFNTTFGTLSQSLTREVAAQYLINGGSIASIENTVDCSVSQDALSNTNSNFIVFTVQRDTSIVDNYVNPAYLLSINVQYKTNFANVAEWAV
jgi:hypothetical protein